MFERSHFLPIHNSGNVSGDCIVLTPPPPPPPPKKNKTKKKKKKKQKKKKKKNHAQTWRNNFEWRGGEG